MGGTSKAAFGVEIQPVFTAQLLSGVLDNYTAGNALFVSHVTTARFLFDFTPGGAGSAFEIVFQTSPDGTNWFDTSIDNLGTLVQVVRGTTSIVDTHVRQFRPYGGKHFIELAVTLNKSTPYLRMLAAEYVNVAPPGTLTVQAMLS